jgi:hypothetical protein
MTNCFHILDVFILIVLLFIAHLRSAVKDLSVQNLVKYGSARSADHKYVTVGSLVGFPRMVEAANLTDVSSGRLGCAAHPCSAWWSSCCC